jgi:MarR family transcriptional regulator, 2-MHQ and catechol-resistance regulon repressor
MTIISSENNSNIEISEVGSAMTTLDRRAADLQEIVQDIVKQFQLVNAAAANGPHVELNVQELRIVELLGDEGPHIMRELAEYLAVAVNSMTSIVDNLENKALVRRLRSEEDRRVVRVELTSSGREVYQSLVEVKLRLFRSMLGALTEDEQEIFLVLFRKIARAGRSQAHQIASLA